MNFAFELGFTALYDVAPKSFIYKDDRPTLDESAISCKTSADSFINVASEELRLPNKYTLTSVMSLCVLNSESLGNGCAYFQ